MRQVLWSICVIFFLAIGMIVSEIVPEIIAKEKTSEKVSTLPSSLDLAVGILDAGELKNAVYNNGLLSTWGWSGHLIPELPAAWYKGYGYIPDFNIWIGIPEGPWNPPGISGPTVSEAQLHGGTNQSDWDPTPGSLGRYHSGDVTVGDMIPEAPLSDVPLMATSTIPESWPMDWYGDRYWPGFWAKDQVTGEELEGVFTADKEVFFSFTDDPFASRDELPNEGFPIGAQVDIQVLSYEGFCAEDFLFYTCRLINNSNWYYTKTYVGFYFDADVENYDWTSIINDRMDWMDFIKKEWDEDLQDTVGYNMAFIYDYRPEPNWRPYVGVKLLETPRDSNGVQLGLTDWHWFEWENRPGVVLEERKELIQYKVMIGDNTDLWPEEDAAYFHPDPEGNLDPHFDSPEKIQRMYPNGTDCVFIISSGPFEWAAHETTAFSFCLIMGDDREDLKYNARIAQGMYNFNYQHQKITVVSPNGGEILSGIQEITWGTQSITGEPIPDVDIFFSSDAGETWETIAVGEENDGEYSWNTVDVPDGVFYLVRIVSGGELCGEDISDAFFAIDNPGEVAPEVMLLSPNGGENISGVYEITWDAGDADGHSITCTIEYSANGGMFWERVVSDIENTGAYMWDTKRFANSGSGLIRLSVTDETLQTGEDQSNEPFTVYNERRDRIQVEPLQGTLGNGLIHAIVVDPTAITGHRYIISFDDSTIVGVLLYDVFDESAGNYVLRQRDEIASENDPELEGPLFDGLRLNIRNWEDISFWSDSSYIKLGPLTDTTNVDFNAIAFIARPADYTVIFTEMGDTSFNNVITPFEIENVTENTKPRIEVQEDFATSDKLWQYGEPVRLWEGNLPTWTINIFVKPDTLGIEELDTIPGPDFHIILNPGGGLDTIWHYILGDTLPLHPGDEIIIKTKRPFVGGDRFAFQTTVTGIDQNIAEHMKPESYYLYQNYPNPFNLQTRIDFKIHQRSSVSLVVFNILGQKVKTLVDERKEMGFYTVIWDGKDGHGSDLASGIYFYRLEASSFSETKRMVLLK